MCYLQIPFLPACLPGDLSLWKPQALSSPLSSWEHPHHVSSLSLAPLCLPLPFAHTQHCLHACLLHTLPALPAFKTKLSFTHLCSEKHAHTVKHAAALFSFLPTFPCITHSIAWHAPSPGYRWVTFSSAFPCLPVYI